MTDEHSKPSEERMAELLRRLDELLLQRQSYQASINAAENADKTPFLAKLIEINSKLLPELRKEVWDSRNRLPSRDANRKELEKLCSRIDTARNGIETQRPAELSKVKEYKLRAELSAAKTNRARARAARKLAQQQRDKDLAKKYRQAGTPAHKIATRKKQLYKSKKAGRVFRKLCNIVQNSACVRNSADLESGISDQPEGRSAC